MRLKRRWGTIMDIDLTNFIPTAFRSIVGGYFFIFVIGGLIHWNWFVRKKDQKDEWKLQPKRWPSKKKIHKAIRYSALNLVFGGLTATCLLTYYLGGGWSMIKINVSDLPLIWHPISLLLSLIIMDASLYYSHRLMHTKFFYKNVHLLHHRWVDPHIFTTVAMHPVEFFFFQIGLILPMFLVPQYWGIYLLAIFYTMIIGMIDHCGIKVKMPKWTLHGGDNRFHDDHHALFHVNFGHHTHFWDNFHGTARQENKEYGEEVFGGFGKNKS